MVEAGATRQRVPVEQRTAKAKGKWPERRLMHFLRPGRALVADWIAWWGFARELYPSIGWFRRQMKSWPRLSPAADSPGAPGPSSCRRESTSSARRGNRRVCPVWRGSGGWGPRLSVGSWPFVVGAGCESPEVNSRMRTRVSHPPSALGDVACAGPADVARMTAGHTKDGLHGPHACCAGVVSCCRFDGLDCWFAGGDGDGAAHVALAEWIGVDHGAA